MLPDPSIYYHHSAKDFNRDEAIETLFPLSEFYKAGREFFILAVKGTLRPGFDLTKPAEQARSEAEILTIDFDADTKAETKGKIDYPRQGSNLRPFAPEAERASLIESHDVFLPQKICIFLNDCFGSDV
jgi:hypothetical protein